MKKAVLISLVLLAFVITGCGQKETKDVTGKAVLEQCIDTDGGNNIEEKGSANGLSDKCVAGLLIEYYCENNQVVNQNLRCPDKCVDGACV